jgi:hypothetical protein
MGNEKQGKGKRSETSFEDSEEGSDNSNRKGNRRDKMDLSETSNNS